MQITWIIFGFQRALKKNQWGFLEGVSFLWLIEPLSYFIFFKKVVSFLNLSSKSINYVLTAKSELTGQ